MQFSHHSRCEKMSALTNIEINNILYSDVYTKKIYRGQIIARGNSDIQKIVNNLKIPSLVLFNTDFKDGIGMHWLVVLYKKEVTIFFDSMGFSPIMYRLPYICSRKGLPVIMNTRNVQNLVSSSLCGQFVTIYSMCLARGYSLNQINNFFYKDPTLNEAIVLHLFRWVKKTLQARQNL